MKISSANKSPTLAPALNTQTVFEKNVEDVVSPIDLVDVEIITGDSSNLSSGRVELSISAINEDLIAAGFETVELVVEEKPNQSLPKSATSAQINEFFQKESEQKKATPEKNITLDLKQNVDNNKLNSIATKNINIVEDEEDIEFTFVKSSNIQFDTQKITNSVVTAKNEQSDNSGTLEIRLGKANETFADKKIDELSDKSIDINDGSLVETPGFNVQSLGNGRAQQFQERNVPEKSPLLLALESSVTNKGNKRSPQLSKVSDIRNSEININTSLQRPLIKSIKRVKKPNVVTERKLLDLPGPTSNVSLKIVNTQTGEVIKKPLPPRRLETVPYKTVYPFKNDINLPKIDISPLGNSQALVSLTNIDPCFRKVTVYRREISQRTFEDNYEQVNSRTNPESEYSFIDNLENARAFKYVCVADDLPLYSFSVFRNAGFKFENVQEPFVFAFQNNQNVVINVRRLPRFCRKLFVFRKSSAENVESLVDSVSLFGKGTDSLRLIDTPPPIEQVIEYKFVWIDENGIENQFEERPKVIYTAKLGVESANINQFSALYDQETNEVKITGEAIVENIFIADNDAELSNPNERTLKAAARSQNIVKIQIRRINLKTEEDEIILKEIINPGISKFESTLLAQNRLTFSFNDSGENAATFGYTPLMDNTGYTYIARIIVYSLGLELRKVSDFEKIDGIRAPGRLRYQFDPAIFDHPLNKELGILPGSVGPQSYMEADIIGQTTKSIARNVQVFESDITDAITLSSEIKTDTALDPVVRLFGSIPNGLLDDLDHLQIEMGYDTVKQTNVIDRLFLLTNTFEYYDYAFDDLACNAVTYRIVGIGKDFSVIFKSEPTIVSLADKKIKTANERRKSLKNYRERKVAEKEKARRPAQQAQIRRGGRNG